MGEYIIKIPNECFSECDGIIHDRYYPDERHDPMPLEEIVRCRDCKSWCGPCEIRPDGIEGVCDGWSATGNVVLTRDDDFCSYGVKRDEE